MMSDNKWYRDSGAGFTLIELMIVVMIIGILAAVAIPAYMTYIFKSRLMHKANWSQTQVNEFVEKGIGWGGSPSEGVELLKKLTDVGYTPEEIIGMAGNTLKEINSSVVNTLVKYKKGTFGVTPAVASNTNTSSLAEQILREGGITPTTTQVATAVVTKGDYQVETPCIDGYEYKIFYKKTCAATEGCLQSVGIIQTMEQDYEGTMRFKTCS